MEQLADDVDALVEQITQFDAKIKNETDAKKAIFSIASILTILVVKTTSKYTGADTLSKTYEEILEGQNDLIFKILDFSIKLDTLPVFPIADLRRLVIECECNKLASTTLKNIVKYRLYMCPIESFKERQKICDAVGLSQKPSLLAGFSKTGSA